MALGFVEIPFLCVTAVVADRLVKQANVRLLGIETTGNENLQVRLQGDVAAIEAALAFATKMATELGTAARVRCLSQPEPALDALLHFPIGVCIVNGRLGATGSASAGLIAGKAGTGGASGTQLRSFSTQGSIIS